MEGRGEEGACAASFGWVADGRSGDEESSLRTLEACGPRPAENGEGGQCALRPRGSPDDFLQNVLGLVFFGQHDLEVKDVSTPVAEDVQHPTISR